MAGAVPDHWVPGRPVARTKQSPGEVTRAQVPWLVLSPDRDSFWFGAPWVWCACGARWRDKPYDPGDHDGAQVFLPICFAESWRFPDRPGRTLGKAGRWPSGFPAVPSGEPQSRGAPRSGAVRSRHAAPRLRTGIPASRHPVIPSSRQPGILLSPRSRCAG